MSIEIRHWLTGCGDKLLTGWNTCEPDDVEVLKLVIEFSSTRRMAHRSKEFEHSGIIYIAVLHEGNNPDWIAELKKLGFKKAARGINMVHNMDLNPLVCMTMHTGNVSERALKYWNKCTKLL